MITIRPTARHTVAFFLLALSVAPAAGQQALTPIGLEQLNTRFEELQTIVSADLAAGTVTLTGGQRDRLNTVIEVVRLNLRAMLDGRPRSDNASALKSGLQNYGAFLRGMYGTPMPARINGPWNAINDAFLANLSNNLAEYDRRFFIRYGAGSEPLNIIEMLIVQALTPAPRGGAVNYPSPWEPIARVQLFGYQFDTEGNELTPSSPVLQLGVTHYLYGTGKIARTIHHIGLGAAYQRDLVQDVHLVGGVLHVASWDLGVFCNADNCAEPVFMASFSFSVFRGLWDQARQWAAGSP